MSCTMTYRYPTHGEHAQNRYFLYSFSSNLEAIKVVGLCSSNVCVCVCFVYCCVCFFALLSHVTHLFTVMAGERKNSRKRAVS